MPWWMFAVASAIAAGATAILAKVGVERVPSNLATAVRTAVVLVFAWGIVIARGEQRALPEMRGQPLLFLGLSGVATGLSWLAYFRALQLAPASRVAPIDRLSLAITIGLAALVLGESMTWTLALGATLMVIGALSRSPEDVRTHEIAYGAGLMTISARRWGCVVWSAPRSKLVELQ